MLCQSSNALLKITLRTFQVTVSVLMTSLFPGESDDVHLENLHRVLTGLQDCGLKLNPDKFFSMLDKVEYLGTTISAETR